MERRFREWQEAVWECRVVVEQGRSEADRPRVTFFTKASCPLCDAAWFVVRKLCGRFDVEIERVDITEAGQERWFGLYCNDIPVVHVNGREVFRHRVSERRLREVLERVCGGGKS